MSHYVLAVNLNPNYKQINEENVSVHQINTLVGPVSRPTVKTFNL